MFPSPRRNSIRYAAGILASFSLIAGCTSTRPTPGAATAQVTHTSQAAAARAPAAPSSTRVIPVHGDIVGKAAPGARFVEGRLLPFRAPSAPHVDKVELYVAAYPTEEFDAELFAIEPLEAGLYTASVRIAEADQRLTGDLHFDGLLVLDHALTGPWTGDEAP